MPVVTWHRHPLRLDALSRIATRVSHGGQVYMAEATQHQNGVSRSSFGAGKEVEAQIEGSVRTMSKNVPD